MPYIDNFVHVKPFYFQYILFFFGIQNVFIWEHLIRFYTAYS